jgi:hypothetical protein
MSHIEKNTVTVGIAMVSLVAGHKHYKKAFFSLNLLSIRINLFQRLLVMVSALVKSSSKETMFLILKEPIKRKAKQKQVIFIFLNFHYFYILNK